MVEFPLKKILRVEKNIEEQLVHKQFRPHLGASEIGRECKREILYNFRWSKTKYITPRLDRLFNRGHFEELIVITDLINIGCKVEGINIDESIRYKFKKLFNHDLPVNQKQISAKWAYGFGGASCDGQIHFLPDAPKTTHLFECKTSNTKGFNQVKRNGVEEAKYQHYVQMQIYMHLFKFKRALYVIVNKETDERIYERVKYNKKIAKKYLRRGEMIIENYNKLPPRIQENKDKYPCMFCEYQRICFSLEKPCKNCRTCSFIGLRSESNTEGKFICELKNKELSFNKQLKGCKKYEVDLTFYQ